MKLDGVFSVKKTGRGALNTSFPYELCNCVGAFDACTIIPGILGLSNCKEGAGWAGSQLKGAPLFMYLPYTAAQELIQGCITTAKGVTVMPFRNRFFMPGRNRHSLAGKV